MDNLIKYIQDNCSACKPDEGDANVVFFGVLKGPNANADELRSAIKAHKGDFCEVDPFDGNEHSYIELGGWLGNQGWALALIGLGAALGMWKLLTPKTVLGISNEDPTARELAGMGLVSLQARPS